MANRNRNAGHKYERETVHKVRDAGFKHAVTSRSESVSRDAQKVDIMNKDEWENGRMPYNIQCKCTATNVNYITLLDELPKIEGITNVILNQRTKKKGTQFYTVGEYAIIEAEDFYQMAKRLKFLEEECGALYKQQQ